MSKNLVAGDQFSSTAELRASYISKEMARNEYLHVNERAPQLRPLKDDPERYENVYVTAFSKIIQKEATVRVLNSFFDSEVKTRLLRLKHNLDEEFRLLGIGVGEGPHEMHFLRSLACSFSFIRLVAVDPNQALLEKFRQKVLVFDTEGRLASDWFNGPFTAFCKESFPSAELKYNLITSIHSIYYIGDLEECFFMMLQLLKDDGYMMIHFQADNNALTQVFSQKHSWIGDKEYIVYSSGQLRSIAEKNGCQVESFPLSVTYDVTAAFFEEESEFGNKLLDFFSMTAYFRHSASPEMLEDMMSTWRSLAKQGTDGRWYVSGEEETLIISKPKLT